jgi:hypothetical protein
MARTRTRTRGVAREGLEVVEAIRAADALRCAADWGVMSSIAKVAAMATKFRRSASHGSRGYGWLLSGACGSLGGRLHLGPTIVGASRATQLEDGAGAGPSASGVLLYIRQASRPLRLAAHCALGCHLHILEAAPSPPRKPGKHPSATVTGTDTDIDTMPPQQGEVSLLTL